MALCERGERIFILFPLFNLCEGIKRQSVIEIIRNCNWRCEFFF